MHTLAIIPGNEEDCKAKANVRYYFYRGSHPEVFCKKGVLGNFTKFTGKHLCQGLFFDKVADLGPAILLKKRLWHRCFPVNFGKFLRTPFLTEHLKWLLLFLKHLHFSFAKTAIPRGYTEQKDIP